MGNKLNKMSLCTDVCASPDKNPVVSSEMINSHSKHKGKGNKLHKSDLNTSVRTNKTSPTKGLLDSEMSKISRKSKSNSTYSHMSISSKQTNLTAFM